MLQLLERADALFNRCYGWRFNPLYQSGTIVLALYLVLLATGLWLVIFYRVSAPWESVDWLTGNLWIGNWVRGLHRYASDAAVLATLVHAGRMLLEGRSWGARTLAWVSGGLLLFMIMACGWTGYVMVWDTFGEALAREGARMLDALPILSEPVSRAFTGERPVPGTFFFITLFAHIGIPLAMGLAFWLHVKRLARPSLLPPRPLMWTTIGLLTAAAVFFPLSMAPKANPFVRPAEIPVDLFFAFWLPVTPRLGAGFALGGLALAAVGLLIVPVFTKRRGQNAPLPSFVDEDLCVGCLQCSVDCPYGAIEMVPRVGRGSEVVARVDPELCVSCGICAGSCAPMGVGPPGRTGRDQLASVHAFMGAPGDRAGTVVVVACAHGGGRFSAALEAEGAVVYPVSCLGNLHTSVVEMMVRGGAAGVLMMACPPRDCWNREGPKWLTERVYREREAELKARVDRRRVRIVHANAGERTEAVAALRAFTADVRMLGAAGVAGDDETEAACEPADPVGTR